MKNKVAVLSMAYIMSACGSDPGSNTTSSVLGYSYDCYGLSYEFPIGSTIMLH